MEEIDWSKAPEWATYLAVSELGHSTWCELLPRLVTGGANWQGGGNWNVSDLKLSDMETRLIPRPSATSWSGEGLPPVGAECEVIKGDCHWEPSDEFIIGKKVKVLALISNQLDQDLAAVESDSGGCFVLLPELLVPIRTAEQIAKDEREAAVVGAFSALIKDGFVIPSDHADYLYSLYDSGHLVKP